MPLFCDGSCRPAPTHACAPTERAQLPGGESVRLSVIAGLGTLALAQEAQAPLHASLCLLLRREYHCLSGLGYTPPPACSGII